MKLVRVNKYCYTKLKYWKWLMNELALPYLNNFRLKNYWKFYLLIYNYFEQIFPNSWIFSKPQTKTLEEANILLSPTTFHPAKKFQRSSREGSNKARKIEQYNLSKAGSSEDLKIRFCKKFTIPETDSPRGCWMFVSLNAWPRRKWKTLKNFLLSQFCWRRRKLSYNFQRFQGNCPTAHAASELFLSRFETGCFEAGGQIRGTELNPINTLQLTFAFLVSSKALHFL